MIRTQFHLHVFTDNGEDVAYEIEDRLVAPCYVHGYKVTKISLFTRIKGNHIVVNRGEGPIRQ